MTVDGQENDDIDTGGGGQLVVELPPPNPTNLARLLFLHVLVPVLAPAFVLYKLASDLSFRSSFPRASRALYSLVSDASERPISSAWYFRDASLLRRLWESPSARAYCRVDDDGREEEEEEDDDDDDGRPRRMRRMRFLLRPLVEYQVREGYCGSATHRCVLRSLGLRSVALPPQCSGESKPESWSERIVKMANDSSDGKLALSTRIIRCGGDGDDGDDGDEFGYDEFVSALRGGLSNENVRVACNFLRSGLMGFEGRGARYVPAYLLLSLLGGHFSPILGIIDKEDDDAREEVGDVGEEEEEERSDRRDIDNDDEYPFVAIFDTNHKYGGVYFAPARRLYDAVRTVDVGSNRHRAIVLVEKMQS